MKNPQHTSSPPELALKILAVVLPAELQECLTGDLEEEFSMRAKHSPKHAKQWFWRQTMQTSLHYISQYLASESMLKRLTIAAAVVLFPSMLIMISWLSNMTHETSESVWNNLLAGKIHTFLWSPEVLVLGVEKILADFDLPMFFNTPATLWAIFSLVVLYLRNKKQAFSAHQAAGWGLILMLLPYMFGLIYIAIIEPEARHVGPPVAFMALSVAYLILPLSWFVLSKIKRD